MRPLYPVIIIRLFHKGKILNYLVIKFINSSMLEIVDSFLETDLQSSKFSLIIAVYF